MTSKLTRRQMIGATVIGLPAIPVVVESAFAQSLPVLSPTEPAAKALGYNENATKVDTKANPNYKPGQICGNCLQWAEKDRKAATGKCNALQIQCSAKTVKFLEVDKTDQAI